MKLVRTALGFYKSLNESFTSCSFSFGDITIDVIKTTKKSNEEILLFYAKTKLNHYPKVTKEGLIVVPDKIRKNLEDRIEKLANLISVSHLSSKNITSPVPCIAFEFEDVNEESWLKSHSGVLYKSRKEEGLRPIGVRAPIDLSKYSEDIADRYDGIALMSEAISHDHLSGKLHEYFRLFERAFKLGADKIVKPMTDYFDGLRYEYSEKEIESWMKVRHSIAHGKASQHNVIESHVAPIFGRVEQAAFDILLNKKNWFNPDPVRRKLWHPDTGTDSKGTFVTRCSKTITTYNILDEFEVFLINLECCTLPFQHNMWHKYISEDNPANGMKIQVGQITSIENFYDPNKHSIQL